MKPEDICTVTNRSSGMVMYKIPEKHIRREFYPLETKKVPYQEILDVVSQPGGRELIYDYLLVKESAAAEEALNIDLSKEVEYSMTEEQVRDFLQTCSLDAFKDALDFAPSGVKDLIKKYAVELPLNDVDKREALKEQAGFDVDAAIKIKKESEAEEENKAPAARRVQSTQDTAVSGQRRVKIIPKKDS